MAQNLFQFAQAVKKVVDLSACGKGIRKGGLRGDDVYLAQSLLQCAQTVKNEQGVDLSAFVKGIGLT